MSIEKEKECIICLDTIDNKQDINFFEDCEHSINYHNECINDWINDCIDKNINPSCPICRKELELINISDLLESEQITNIHNQQLQIDITNVSDLLESEQITNIHNQQLQTDITNVYSFFYYTQRFCCICIITIFFSIFLLEYFNKKL